MHRETLERPPVRPGASAVGRWIRWFGPGRVLLAALGVVVAAVGAAWALRAPPPAAEPPPATVPGTHVTDGAVAGGRAGPGTDATVPAVTLVGRLPTTVAATAVVHVAGRVRRPGVHEVPADARVADALTAAGGPEPDAELDALNLAAPVVDGGRIYVPAEGEVAVGPEPLTDGRPTTVDVNRAPPDELEQLRGVGPAIAAAIVDERERHGPFASVDDLVRVPGIGPAKLAALRDQVVIGPGAGSGS